MSIVVDIIKNIRIIDILDIIIVAYIFYQFLMLVRETRAEQLIKGIIVLLIASKVSEWSKLYMIHYILKNTLTLGVVALLIVFQPELRRALEYIGRSKLFSKSIGEMIDKETEEIINELTEAISDMSKNKVGALIVLERETGLNDIIQTGVNIDSKIVSELILNIFTPKTPLHDGAIVIRKERIVAASCLLPLTNNTSLKKELGTRHRAALGMIENSDAIVIIVSEETGIISVAMNGKLKRYLDVNATKKLFKDALIEDFHRGINFKKWWIKND
ncbi:MAG: diadenylate cyclase CdaA [Clostridiales bacterium]|nr:diadenylate cyclase CdaA [Clostridiales bacterium]